MNLTPSNMEAHEMSVGELKAIHRESHLCLHCGHQSVCKIAAAIDPNLLVIIQQCLAFVPEGGHGGDFAARD